MGPARPTGLYLGHPVPGGYKYGDLALQTGETQSPAEHFPFNLSVAVTVETCVRQQGDVHCFP
jgi:hypothetical protein